MGNAQLTYMHKWRLRRLLEIGTTIRSNGSIVASLRHSDETHGVLEVVLIRTFTKGSGQNSNLIVVYR